MAFAGPRAFILVAKLYRVVSQARLNLVTVVLTNNKCKSRGVATLMSLDGSVEMFQVRPDSRTNGLREQHVDRTHHQHRTNHPKG